MSTKHSHTLQKQFLPTGYRLHAMRLQAGGRDTPLRTFKYPLEVGNSGVKTKLTEAVFAEYRALEGIRTIEDWYKNPDSYSVIDLWFDSLCVGGMFRPNEPALRRFGQQLTGGEPVEELFFRGIPVSLQSCFKKKEWIEQFTKELRSNGSRRQARFDATLLDLSLVDNPEVAAVRKQWLTAVPEGSGITREDHIALVAKIFHTDIAVFREKSPSGLDLTFLIDPRLPRRTWVRGRTDRSNLLTQIEQDRAELLRNEGLDPIEFESIAGLSDNGNALSNYLNKVLKALRSTETRQLLEEMAIRRPYTNSEREEVKNRLDFLASRAQLIPESLFASGWHDHRSTIVGRLTSYLSNRRRLAGAQEERVQAITDELKEILAKHFSGYGDIDIAWRQRTDEITRVIGQVKAQRDPSLTEIIEEELGELRSELNRRIQAESSEKALPDMYPKLARGLPRPPRFPADDRVALFTKYCHSPETIIRLLRSLEPLLVLAGDILDHVSAHEAEVLRRGVCRTEERKYVSNLLSNEFVTHARSTLSENGQVKGVYWKSPQARSRVEVIDPPQYPLISELGASCRRAIFSLVPSDCVHKPSQVLALGEVVRTVVAAILSRVDQRLLDDALESILKSDNDTIRVPLEALQRALPGNTHKVLERFSQRIIASEVRGMLAMLSRTTLISRAIIHTTGGEQSELAVQAREQAKRTYGVQVSLEVGASEADDLRQWKRVNKVGLVKMRKGGSLFPLVASTSQRQFLERIFSPSKLLSTNVNEASLIAERELAPQWTPVGTLAGFEVKREVIYHAQPFTFSAQGHRELFAQERYMGLDVGEYGIAWCAIDVSGSVVRVLGSGMIQDPQYKKLQRAVDKLRREDQPRGTFTIASTRVARIRESLAGALRNRIHALALRYHAKPTFEFEIDAFESGADRIKKVYATVKKADVGVDKVAEQLRDSLWGTKRMVGMTVAAGGTSQCCSKCHRWFQYAFAKETWQEVRRYLVEPVSAHTGVYTVTIDAQTLYLYWEKSLNHGEINGSDLRKAIKQYLRPPVSEGRESAAVRHAGISQHAQRSGRGASHQFICPFVDCGHHADADLQAAYSIAIKGWLKDAQRGARRSPGGQVRASGEYISYSQEQWLKDLQAMHSRVPAYGSVAVKRLPVAK